MPRVGQALGIAALATALAAGDAVAANQGSLGNPSQGDLTITLTIDPLVQISRIDDIPLGTYTGGAAMTGADDLCVFSNNGGYNITATGSGPAGEFELASATDTIQYTVEWATSAGAGSGTALTSGSTLAGLGGSSSTPDCGSVDNAQVIVNVSTTALGDADTGAYSGVLFLEVAPL